VEGLTVFILFPEAGSTNSPSMNSPWVGEISGRVCSGAGAYSQAVPESGAGRGTVSGLEAELMASGLGHIVGGGVVAGSLLVELAEEVVEQA